ncbi:hypothetical protein MAPG_10679 [Magnaporthiopsis poae ATCC 64411]|uniref:PD-(D/E)XK nuclease-like domain-containing protein n=1 Tax=Magnaporthiopsis poae (strain ATCC 64411 / 73-15) TaxID=644358 RepID=A0A0C4ED85_MAGP6|nr:hypothetical protein MAPG_10679 [Magnaporthiopsis poae ATCC 64411]
MYEPLALKPIGVSVCVENKAKDDSDDDDGSVRLAVWTAAWHRRISELLPHVVSRGGIMTLPLLVCNGHAWSLYFACDRGIKIEMIGPISLGGTYSLSSTYALFAALQELCRWVGGPFREWLGTALKEESTDSGSW